MKELRYFVSCTRGFFFFFAILYPRDEGSIFFQNITKFLPLHNLYSHRSENVKSGKISLYFTGMFEGEAKLARHTHLCSCDLCPYTSNVANNRSLGQGLTPSSEEPEGSMAALTTTRVWTISPVCKFKI